MSKTEVSGKQLKDGSVQRVDLDVSTSGEAVIAKVVAGDNISISSTGADAGTGDVTISLGGTIASDITSLDTRVDALESDVAAVQSAGVPNIEDLGGVAINSPSADQVLKYDGTGWVNAAAPETGASSLDELSDVAVSSAVKGQFIVHDGTQFVNSNTIQGLTNQIGLVVKAAANPTEAGEYPFSVQNSLGQGMFFVASSNTSSNNFTGVANRLSVGGGGAFPSAHLHVVSDAAANKGLIVQGAASQTANLLEVQNSAGANLFAVDKFGALYPSVYYIGRGGKAGFAGENLSSNLGIGSSFPNVDNAAALNNIAIGYSVMNGLSSGSENTAIGHLAGCHYGSYQNTLIGFSTWGPSNVHMNKTTIVGARCGNSWGVQNSLFGAEITTNTAGTSVANATAIGYNARVGSNALAIGRLASAADNCFDLRFGGSSRITGDSSGNIDIANTLHAKRYTETVANAFDSSLSPSSGTLTVDTSVGNAVLGALSASVTTWAFTNVPTDNSKVTTVSAIVAGNTAYTYGSACSVNGSAVATGVQWFGGTAPSASSSTDVLTFVIVKDSAGTIRVLGSGQTIDSVVGSASAGIDGAGSANYLSKWTDANTIANSAIFESAGNVGIGTTSPGATIDVNSTTNFQQILTRFTADGTGSRIQLRKSRAATSGTNTIVQAGDECGGLFFSGANGTGYDHVAAITGDSDTTPGASSDMPGRLRFYTTSDGASSPTERMRIDSGGKVLIGRTSAVVGETFSSTGYAIVGSSTGGQGQFIFGGNGGGATLMGSYDNTPVIVRSNNTERMRIASDGTIGIAGGQSSIRRLGIHGLGTDNNTISLYCGQSGGSLTFCVYDGGDVRAPYVYSKTTASGANMFVGSDGTFYRSTSSLKYKTDVQNIEHGLNEVLQLRPVTYKGNNDGNKVFGGLIAEEVHDAGLTEFVQYAEDGTPDALAYGNMVSLAFKAIQELNAKVDALQAEKEALEARLAALENN